MGNTLLLILLGFAVVVLAVGAALTRWARLERSAEAGVAGRGTIHRPWSSPSTWLVLGAAMLVLGIVVLPRLFGFAFLFLPFVWMRGFGRRRSDPGAPPDGGA